MADVSERTIEELWRETPEYSWESLRQGLERIRHREVVSYRLYDRLRWIIDKLQSLRIDFPKTPSELEDRINYYM